MTRVKMISKIDPEITYIFNFAEKTRQAAINRAFQELIGKFEEPSDFYAEEEEVTKKNASKKNIHNAGNWAGFLSFL